MIRTVVDSASGQEWIDVIDPTESELMQLAAKYDLPAGAVHDSLDADHLPKNEDLDGVSFIIVRHADEATYNRVDADTIQELTRKVALFSGPNFLLTVHRTDPKFLNAIYGRWSKSNRNLKDFLPHLILDLFRGVLLSYTIPLDAAESHFEDHEFQIFNKLATEQIVEDIYFLKRKVAVYKRMLRQTLDVIIYADGPLKNHPELFRDLRDEGRHVFLFSDELNEDVNHLLNTHISLASHRTNEIIRVLTLFSVFFMPLTFLVGVYGMNFHFMPELQTKWGYPAVWAVMLLISAAIFVWFRRKGWIHSKRARPASPHFPRQQ